MPTIRAPDGRRLRVPDNATPEDIQAVLEAQGYDLSGAAPPAVSATPPGAGLPGLPSPAPGGVAATLPAPTPQAPGGAPGPSAFSMMSTDEKNAFLAQERAQADQDMLNQMSGYEKFASGMGQSVDSTVGGIRQLWNYLSGDDQELAQLQALEADTRKTDAPLLSTGAGRTGQITGHVMQAALPAGVIAKGAKAANMGLVGTGIAESALGAGMGAAQPTTADESRLSNTLIGAAAGGVIPAAQGLGSTLARYPTTVLANALRSVSPRGTGGIVDLAVHMGKQGADVVRRKAGKAIGEITQGVRVPLGKELAAKLRSVKADYAKSLPDDVTNKLDQWIKLAESGKASVKGDAVQEARSAVAREAASSEGVKQSGLNRITRILDDATEGQLTQAQIKALRKARELYRTGIAEPLIHTGTQFRAALRGLVEGTRAQTAPTEQR